MDNGARLQSCSSVLEKMVGFTNKGRSMRYTRQRWTILRSIVRDCGEVIANGAAGRLWWIDVAEEN